MLTIVDYNCGNLKSVKRTLDLIGSEAIISSDPKEIALASKIILPGVGHFGNAMSNLESSGIHFALNEAVLEKKTPILGICLGMQIMTSFSEEGNVKGLNWIDAKVKKFNPKNTLRYKSPHTGWNTVEQNKNSLLFNGIIDPEFYFVHGYYVECNQPEDILNTTTYEMQFVSAFEKENIFGVQYHPEKSHKFGQQLIKNFTEI